MVKRFLVVAVALVLVTLGSCAATGTKQYTQENTHKVILIVDEPNYDVYGGNLRIYKFEDNGNTCYLNPVLKSMSCVKDGE